MIDLVTVIVILISHLVKITHFSEIVKKKQQWNEFDMKSSRFIFRKAVNVSAAPRF